MTVGRVPVRRLAIAALLALGCELLVWLPALGNPDVLVRHFDGPNYLVVAKTLYRPTTVNPLPGYIATPRYFAVHLPAYPLAVRVLAPVAGWPAALLLATALFAMASAAAFVLWTAEVLPDAPWLPLLAAFLLLPPRSLLYRALGATEAPMVLFVLVAVWAYRRELPALAFAAASLSSVCRINGLLVVGVLAAAYLLRRRVVPAVAGGFLALVPLGLVFAWQNHVLGTGLAFLQAHHGKGQLVPFAAVGQFIGSGDWVVAELLVITYLFHVLAAARLFRRGFALEAALVAAHVALLSLVREPDVPRYFLTVAPFAFVLAWDDVLGRRETAFAVLALAALVGFPYAWGSLSHNLCEPAVYRHLLDFLAEPLHATGAAPPG